MYELPYQKDLRRMIHDNNNNNNHNKGRPKRRRRRTSSCSSSSCCCNCTGGFKQKSSVMISAGASAVVLFLIILLSLPPVDHSAVVAASVSGNNDSLINNYNDANNNLRPPPPSSLRRDLRNNNRRGGGQRGRGRGHNNQGQRRHNGYNSTTGANSAYVHRRHRRRRKGDYYTHLSDVLFCLAMALGWTVWMLSAFIRSDLSKYQKNSVLVRGHVLQVSVETDSLGTGIPTYKAIVDYFVPKRFQPPNMPNSAVGSVVNALRNNTMRTASVPPTGGGTVATAGGGGINNNSNSVSLMEGASVTATINDADGCFDEDRIQIRKQFETQKLLQEGFANVELLVLPNEPTYSVLKEDWEKEWEENRNGDDIEWWNTKWFRRTSMTAAGALVLASVGGGVHVVTLLRLEQRIYGYIMICVGVAFLLPLAIAVHYAMQIFQRLLNYQAEKNGIVINSRSNTPRNGHGLAQTPHGVYSTSAAGGGGNNSIDTTTGAPAAPFSCEGLDYLDPQMICPDDNCNDMANNNNGGTTAQDYYYHQYYDCHGATPTIVSGDGTAGMGDGCYLIHFPNKNINKPQLSVVDSSNVDSISKGNEDGGGGDSMVRENSSVSTVSSISLEEGSTTATTGGGGGTSGGGIAAAAMPFLFK